MTALFPDVVHAPEIVWPDEFFIVAPVVVAARSIEEYVSVRLIVTDVICVLKDALFAGVELEITGALSSRTTVNATDAL